MKNKYTVTEAAKILGITRMGLHASIRQGYLNAKTETEGKQKTKYIKGRDLKEYALAKRNKLQGQLDNMKLEEFEIS